MGARGPLRITPHLKVVNVQGSAAAEVQPVGPVKPAAVKSNRELSLVWDELAEYLAKDGLLARSDAATLELAVRHFWLARKASNQAGRKLTISDDRHGEGVRKNPAEAVFRAESSMFLRYAQQLGMTFAGRARTPAAAPGKGAGGDGKTNPFAPPESVG